MNALSRMPKATCIPISPEVDIILFIREVGDDFCPHLLIREVNYRYSRVIIF